MIVNLKQLPDDIAALKKIIVEQQVTIQTKSIELEKLRQIAFGHRSEKRSLVDIRQGLLFNEVEQIDSKAMPSQIKVKSHKRKKRGRKALPDDLPTRETIHDLREDQKTCACGHELSKIGQDELSELHFIPARLEVEKHIFNKYACKRCEGTSDETTPGVITNRPKRILPGTMASASLLTYIIISKYKDALPLYRLEGIFRRLKIEIKRTTMANWIIQAHRNLAELRKLMLDELRSSPVVSMDETTVQVLKESGRSPQSKSWMWCTRNYDKNPIVFFHYSPSRGSTVVRELLGDFKGTLLSDGWPAYFTANADANFINASCNVHCRRNFIPVADEGNMHAEYIVSLYAILFKVEEHARIKNRSKKQLLRLRQKVSKPAWEKIVKYCKELMPREFGAITLGKACRYLLKHEQSLSVFLDDANVPLDNNRSENDIRPFVIGRKNWLFSDSVAGAEASAFWYSLLETANQNGHTLQNYLAYLLIKAPYAQTSQELKELLPNRLSPEIPNKFFDSQGG